ncbi:MAG: hypothetical protein AAGC60_02615 [Acidobacteriota bacterium]
MSRSFSSVAARRVPRSSVAFVVALILALLGSAVPAVGQDTADDADQAAPPIGSLSVLAFAPSGELLIGDSKNGTVWAFDLGERTPRTSNEATPIGDLETQIAALLGTRSSEVMIHDLAVDRITQEIYLAVSRGRATWESRWQLPNDVADAQVLLKVTPEAEILEVPLAGVPYRQARLPNPIAADKMSEWKGSSLRADAISDLAVVEDDDGGASVVVAGLSNEEFASTLWRLPWPFADAAGESNAASSATSIEIFHGAHGVWETHSPIRAFVPYRLDGAQHLLAAYLCTPFVTLPVAALDDGAHLRGRTIAEFGWGNYPLDMVVYRKDGRDRVLIANSNQTWMIVDAEDIARYEGEITREVEGFTAGVAFEQRSGAGIQQMDLLNDEVVVFLQRQPGGTLNLSHFPTDRL